MDNDVVFSFKNSLHIEKQITFFFLFFSFCKIIKTAFKSSLELVREMNLGFAQNRVIYNFEQKWGKKLQLNVTNENNLIFFLSPLKRFFD